MPVSKSIVKMNHMEAIVKVVNSDALPGSITIDLDVDLLKSNEELTTEPIVVNFGSVEASVSVDNSIEFIRNGEVVMNIFENFEQFELPWGADPQNNTHDIVVNFTGAGTAYIRLLKVKGYRPLFRPEQGVNLL